MQNYPEGPWILDQQDWPVIDGRGGQWWKHRKGQSLGQILVVFIQVLSWERESQPNACEYCNSTGEDILKVNVYSRDYIQWTSSVSSSLSMTWVSLLWDSYIRLWQPDTFKWWTILMSLVLILASPSNSLIKILNVYFKEGEWDSHMYETCYCDIHWSLQINKVAFLARCSFGRMMC